jgi:hypothetical protein
LVVPMSENSASGCVGVGDIDNGESSVMEHESPWFNFHVDSPRSDGSDTRQGAKRSMTPVHEWDRPLPHSPPKPERFRNESRDSGSSVLTGMGTDLGALHSDLYVLSLTNALAATDEDEVSVLTSCQEVYSPVSSRPRGETVGIGAAGDIFKAPDNKIGFHLVLPSLADGAGENGKNTDDLNICNDSADVETGLYQHGLSEGPKPMEVPDLPASGIAQRHISPLGSFRVELVPPVPTDNPVPIETSSRVCLCFFPRKEKSDQEEEPEAETPRTKRTRRITLRDKTIADVLTNAANYCVIFLLALFVFMLASVFDIPLLYPAP